MNTNDPIIGRRVFIDGKTSEVYLGATGQYVIGDDGAWCAAYATP